MRRVSAKGAMLAVVCAMAASAFGQSGRDYDGYRVVRVEPQTVRQMQGALTIAEELWSEHAGLGPFDVVVNDEQLDALRGLGLAPVVLVDDLGPIIRAERDQITQLALQEDLQWYENFKQLHEIEAYVAGLVAAHPQLISTQIIGQSIEGRNIMAARVTGPGDASDRPAFFMNGCQHAREWVSPMTVTYIADQLVSGYGIDAEITALMDRVEFLFVFVVNPDGYTYSWSNERLWRKNKRRIDNVLFGVDTNRNWDIAWGGAGSSGTPSNETYRGTAPFSEPETAAVRDFVHANPRIAAHIDFHSFSQLILYPWGWQGAPPLPADDLATFETLSGDMSDAILSTFGEFYTPQPAIDLYAAAGVMSDWTYTQDILGFTIELRPSSSNPGFILPADEIIPTAQENFEAIKVVSRYLAFPISVSPDALPTFVASNTPAPVRFTILETTDTLASATLFARVGVGAFAPSSLTNVGGDAYEGMLPAAACEQVIEYYVEAQAAGGDLVQWPIGGSAAPAQATALDVLASFADAMETGTGWTVGAAGDAATTGLWERADPEPTAAQPGDDHTPGGTLCFITDATAGSGVGSFDIDGGATTLTSPTLDGVGGSTDPLTVLSYWRWYSNDQGAAPNADSMPVLISNDDGASWVTLEIVTENANSWVFKSFVVNDFVTPTSSMRVRFVASDLGSGSIVEAGVDDFALTVLGCDTCPGDITGDGNTNTNDFFAFLALYQASDPRADFTGEGDVNTNDFFAFLAAYAQCQ